MYPLKYKVVTESGHFESSGTFWNSEEEARQRARKMTLELGEPVLVMRVFALYRKQDSPVIVEEF